MSSDIDLTAIHARGELARWHRPGDGSSAVLKPNGVLLLRVGHYGRYAPRCECSSVRAAELRLKDEGGEWVRRPSLAFESAQPKKVQRKDLSKVATAGSDVCRFMVLVGGIWIDSGKSHEEPELVRRQHRVRQYERRLFLEGRRLFEAGKYEPMEKERDWQNGATKAKRTFAGATL